MIVTTPVELSKSGDYIAGEVLLPAPVDPDGRRQALYPAASVFKTPVGWESDFELDAGERAWVAIQLDKSARYHELIQRMAGAGQMALRPGPPGGYSASASGLYAPTSWALLGVYHAQAMQLLEQHRAVHLAAALWSRLDAAGSASAIVRLIEDDPIARLPTHIWTELDRLAAAERNTHA